MPLTLPFHATLSEADAPVVDIVTQLRGLAVNDPVTVPFVMLTAEFVDEQPDNLPVTAEGPVPPPVLVSDGEKETLADSAQLTKPGAAPENLGDLTTLAEAGWASG